jgi:hypothetical protein
LLDLVRSHYTSETENRPGFRAVLGRIWGGTGLLYLRCAVRCRPNGNKVLNNDDENHKDEQNKRQGSR